MLQNFKLVLSNFLKHICYFNSGKKVKGINFIILKTEHKVTNATLQ